MPADAGRPTRLWRYALSTDPDRTGLPAVDVHGRAEPLDAYETGAAGVRGVLALHPSGATAPDWYLGRAPDDGSDGRARARTDGTEDAPGDRGTLVRQNTDGTRATECGADRSQHCWTPGAGPLAYRPETGEVWSQSGRMLFAVPLTSVDGSLG